MLKRIITGTCLVLFLLIPSFLFMDTLFLPATAEYQHFSSSMAREMIRYGQPLEKYLPAAILPLVREMRKDEEHG